MTSARASTYIGPRPVPRSPAASAIETRAPTTGTAPSERHRDRPYLIRLATAAEAGAASVGAKNFELVARTAVESLVALEAAEDRAQTAEHRLETERTYVERLQQALLEERAKMAALLAQSGDRFDEETVNRVSPILAQERRTSVVGVPGEGAQAR